MKHPSDFIWYELNWHRPFSLDDVHLLLSRISALTPRGFVAFEARSLNGQVSYYVGFATQYDGKMREVFQSAGDIELVEMERNKRKPMSIARRLTVSKPILSLNVDVASSVIRSGLAALSATRTGEEAVVQIALGRGFPPSPVPRKLSDPHESRLDKAVSNPPNRKRNSSCSKPSFVSGPAAGTPRAELIRFFPLSAFSNLPVFISAPFPKNLII